MSMMRRIVNLFLIPPITAMMIFSTTPSSEEYLQKFSLLFIGDILLANEAERHILTHGIDYPFRNIKSELLKYDYVIGNLETPITTRGAAYTNKAYSFRLSPSSALSLKNLKLDAVTISNNHLMDYGKEGMEDTITFLDGLSIRHAGGGKNLFDARRPALLKCGNVAICILAYCDRPPVDYYASGGKPGISHLNLEHIKDDIAAWKTRYNIVIISLHWGIEQTHEPQWEQIDMAHKIIDAGADGIIGHHPHWPQGIEIYRSKPVVYSLGNFISGFTNPVERDNMAVAWYYVGNTLERIKIIPVAGRNRKIRYQPHVLEGPDASALLRLVQHLSSKLKTQFEISGNYGLLQLYRHDVEIGEKHEPVIMSKPD
jgi:poly-gamma-glutamate synthesis protein (capsule biosynthesis protein)